jgi:uncharacterized membrane protein (DUF2068 family)
MNGAAGAGRAIEEAPFVKKRAPTLYCIIGFKLLKGTLFVLLAWAAFALSDNDLAREFRSLLRLLGLDPDRQFWSHLAMQIGQISEAKVIWVGIGTLAFSLFSWVEGIGLICRASWAGWLAIGESAFFIPLELYDLSQHFRWGVVFILGLNILIFWYLFVNRHRLFRHHHHHH